MDLHGLIKLAEAELHAAHRRVIVAGKLADVAPKVAQLDLSRQETIKQRLANVAKALDIKWDVQAHDRLLKIRDRAMEDAERLKDEAENVREFTDRLGRLLSGDGNWTAIRDAWMAFEFFRGRVPTAAAVKLGRVRVESPAYSADSWRHPENNRIDDVPASERDLEGLWRWARRRTLYPKSHSAAWNALAACLEAMCENAAARADKMGIESDEAEMEAIEFEKLDWERLKAQG